MAWRVKNLPRRIPRRLRHEAIHLDGFDPSEAAWSKEDALEVVASLQNTNVVIAEVTVVVRTPLNEFVADGSWVPEPSRGELGTEYAARTQRGAADFIAKHDAAGVDAVFALRFPLRREAA